MVPKLGDVAITLLLGVSELEALGILDQAVIQTVMAQATAAVVGVADLLRIRLKCLSFRRCFPDATLLLITYVFLAANRLVLSRALPFRPGWIFPSHLPRAAVPRSGQYCGHLITGQNVRDLMAALPWNVLTGANIPEPMSFEITVDGRLGFLIERYSAVEFQDLIAYWESTQRFPVSSALIRSKPYLASFVVERKNR
ncbi:hypothetical protein PHMEG_00037121 [Phytophthora megakarya]|uniref:Uncharacterized protein n=1 Tax=Phytophthora megakarya TaxID=4795 RepID=A0A225ULQ4_9STRA|nr:hypothetical protein PHMEG_00037121 [Phytophthora megakarya]